MEWRGRMKQEWRKDGIRISGSDAFPASNPLDLDLENLERLIERAKKTPFGLLEDLFPIGE